MTNNTEEKLNNEIATKIKREAGPDIIKTIAVLSVICVHFYGGCGYYGAFLNTGKLFVMTVFRWLFMICVPLFMMITGYFKSEKTINKKHYMSLVPLIIAYVIISIFTMLILNYVYGSVYDFMYGVKNILNYQMAWYMGMYLSLVLLIPFLNKMFKACSSRKEHNILIGSLIFISMLYPVCLYVAPSYWGMLYPFVYYFLGTYIKIYRPKINKLLLLAILIVTVLIEASVSWYFAKGAQFVWAVLGPVDNGYSSFTVAVCATCVFLLFYDVDLKEGLIKKIFSQIAKVSFEVYLFSMAYDAIVFYYVKAWFHVDGAEQFFWWFFVTVPASFILSFISSMIYRAIYDVTVNKIIKNK